jgi:hypothetical protein
VSATLPRVRGVGRLETVVLLFCLVPFVLPWGVGLGLAWLSRRWSASVMLLATLLAFLPVLAYLWLISLVMFGNLTDCPTLNIAGPAPDGGCTVYWWSPLVGYLSPVGQIATGAPIASFLLLLAASLRGTRPAGELAPRRLLSLLVVVGALSVGVSQFLRSAGPYWRQPDALLGLLSGGTIFQLVLFGVSAAVCLLILYGRTEGPGRLRRWWREELQKPLSPHID